jgi:hypothetical protein
VPQQGEGSEREKTVMEEDYELRRPVELSLWSLKWERQQQRSFRLRADVALTAALLFSTEAGCRKRLSN